MNPYFEQKILSAEPVELVGLLYQRAISCVIEAREHLKARRIEERSRAISNAYAALHELLASLHVEAAPELAGRLRGMYSYTQQRLLDANFRQDDAPLAEVLGLLSTLVDAWNQIASGGRTEEEPSEFMDGPWYSSGRSGEAGQIAVSA